MKDLIGRYYSTHRGYEIEVHAAGLEFYRLTGPFETFTVGADELRSILSYGKFKKVGV